MSQEIGTQTGDGGKCNAENLCHALVQATEEEKSCQREKAVVEDFPEIIIPLFWETGPGEWARGVQTQTRRSLFLTNQDVQVNKRDIKKYNLPVIEPYNAAKRKIEEEKSLVKSKVCKYVNKSEKIIKPLALIDKPTSKISEVFYPEINYIPATKQNNNVQVEYNPTSKDKLEKLRINKLELEIEHKKLELDKLKMNNIELELEKLIIDQTINKTAATKIKDELKNRDGKIYFGIDLYEQLAQLIFDNVIEDQTLEVMGAEFRKLRGEQEEIPMDIDKILDLPTLTEESIRDFWPGEM